MTPDSEHAHNHPNPCAGRSETPCSLLDSVDQLYLWFTDYFSIIEDPDGTLMSKIQLDIIKRVLTEHRETMNEDIIKTPLNDSFLKHCMLKFW